MFLCIKTWWVKRVDLMDKLTILADSAKYDAACTSSGVDRAGGKGIGNAVAGGCCHTFAADGRCISLLKVLLSNHCIYDC
jgi:predicted DNA-binding helix-hairpin-helix protein